MEPRIAYNKYSPNALHAMYALEKHLKSSTIEEKLLHLIKLHASQINGCAYCIDMHSIDARALGDKSGTFARSEKWSFAPGVQGVENGPSPSPRLPDTRF